VASPKWSGYFKVVSSDPGTVEVQDNQSIDGSTYGNYTWYMRLRHGSASRITKYYEYDVMDNDVDVARALDTIAEEMTNSNVKTSLPIDITFVAEENEPVTENVIYTLRAALRHWCEIHKWQDRLFPIARQLVKYGDVFFRKPSNYKMWEYVAPTHVLGAIVDEEDITKVYGFQIRANTNIPTSAMGGKSYEGGHQAAESDTVPSKQLVRFTLNDDMSDKAPFGESLLASVYRAHKQKELLEDAVVIYRISRAPERRVFYIDVGKMPPHRTKKYLEQIKNEIKQKRIPSQSGGQSTVDSVYNPMSTLEDFYFSVRENGKGSRVETLPGGGSVGEVSDLEWFQNRVDKGLRIPSSYRNAGGENPLFNDGKVGTAYIEELRFSKFVQRLQRYIETPLDAEFKEFLHSVGIHIDPTLFKLTLPVPSNFGTYRQQELDSALLGTASSAEGIASLSKRFVQSRYLQLTDDEIIINQKMLMEEKGIKPGDEDILPKLYNAEYASQAGLGDMGGLGPELGGGGFGGGGEIDFGEEGDDGEMGDDLGLGDEGGSPELDPGGDEPAADSTPPEK